MIPIIECQTAQDSWLDHVTWADAWLALTGEDWGCDRCGARTFHEANVARAEAYNRWTR